MRILKIAGQNIASLADPFSIDLTAEPLRSAGLFAITGQTGAGKSSILDAMCLALYGDAPRLSAGSGQDEVPDAGGESIKAKDPRAILRRGANQAWASVTFTGIDGQDYEARWSARRARDRADGRLQGVARQVARVSDGQVLAAQLSHVSDTVQSLTGLSYDEFRRTVLLAQGDFDAFLRAETNERAALLEKVTGTGLYRAISTSVFERTAEAQAALTLLTQQRDAHALLPDTAVAALQDERAGLEAAVQAARADRIGLEADLTRHRRLTEAQRLLAEADLALAAAYTRAEEAEPARQRLAEIDRAEPLRLPYGTLQQAKAAETRTTEALSGAVKALDLARARRLTRHDVAASAIQQHDATEVLFKTLGPVWTEATQLDSRLAEAAAEAGRAQEEAAQADSRAKASLAALDALRARAAQTNAALNDAQARLLSLTALAPMVEGWDSLARDLADRQAARLAEATAQSQQTRLATEIAKAGEQLAALDVAGAQDVTARQAVEAEARHLLDQISAIEATAPQNLLTGLTALTAALTGLDRARQDHLAATMALANATQQKAGAEAEALAATTAIALAEAALTRAEAAAKALSAPAEQAHLAVSEAARTLRLHLQPDQPCPVCGSPDHPAHDDSALAALAASLRADLTRAQSEATTARAQMTAGRGDLAGATARVLQAGQVAYQQGRLAAQALRDWAGGLQGARAHAHCPALPDAPPATLTPQMQEVDTARQSALQTLSDLTTLRSKKDRAEASRHSLTTAIEARTTTRRSLSDQLAGLSQQAALAAQTAEAAGQRRGVLDRSLGPVLGAAGEPLAALDTDPSALQDRLQARVQAFRAAQDRQASLQTALTDLQPALATAEAALTEARDQAAKAALAAAARAQTHSVLQTERATLLDGEPTEAHRTRHNLARLHSQTAKDQAAAALAEAEAALGQAMGTHDSAVAALAQAEAARHAAEAALNAALAGSGLDETLPALFALPRAEVEALRQSLRLAEDAVTAALSTQGSRQSDLAQVLAGGLPAESAEALTTGLTLLDEAQSTRQERIGALNTELAADQATRVRLAGLQGQIATAQATAEVWAAVNAAVGSAKGDKFAQIAQSITLDQLVDHANHHLADLKPRYRLQRAGGLALQVLDMEMGAEARATRSLSGGERFLVSLALALALSRMGDKGGLAATLFIDEGFGSLDAETLDVAIDALETLQAQGRTIGVISHVEAMKDRIPVQIRVQRQGGGKSTVSLQGGAPF